ncbi:MAG: GNAT family N-acetyltransferase [Micrococcaceae bacterium]
MNYLENPMLEKNHIRLEPLSNKRHDDLVLAVQKDELWETWYTAIPKPEYMLTEIKQHIKLHSENKSVPWAVIDTNSGKATHSTKTNPAAKLLLLTRAFEDLNCIAVEFRTHWLNQQSCAAIEKLGAKQDGILRNHRIVENGTLRYTVVYSIIESEWPTVKFRLQERLKS